MKVQGRKQQEALEEMEGELRDKEDMLRYQR
jgi:hypothetical protein